MLAVELPPEIEDRLETLAKAAGQTKASFASEALIEHVTDLEDLQIAERRLAANQAGKSETVTLEEVMKRYGLES